MNFSIHEVDEVMNRTNCTYEEAKEALLASDGEIVADCYLIAVEKREPFRCGVWKLTDGILDACVVETERAIAELAECRRTNVWPTKTEDLRILDV